MSIRPGQTLQQRYRIASLLGQGGMGAVYRAWDSRLEVPVALKEMVPQTGLDARTLSELRQQFRQEATVLARLHHPSLVRVTDFFEEEDNAYLVMSFVEGQSLARRIDLEGALDEALILPWADQLLDALTHCHANGVIHRDVKPQNVIITPDGRAVLVDFGLVKLWNPADPRTRTAMRGMGTPEYAPPEQYDAHIAHTDARSDVYALGATLYHALTGRTPPTATQRVVDPSVLRPIREANPSISVPIAAALTRSIELRPDARYASAAELREALHGNHSIPQIAKAAAPPHQPSRDSAYAGRSEPRGKRAARARMYGVPGIALVIGGVALIASLAVGASSLFNRRASGRPTETLTPALRATAPAIVTPGAGHTERAVATATIQPATSEVPAPSDTTEPEPSPVDARTEAPTVVTPPTPARTNTLPPTVALTATSSPPCPSVAGPFFELWQELRDRLGCALNQAHATLMAEQTFDGGRMYWREDRDSVYAVDSDGAWAGYPNSWQDGDPIYSCPKTAPESSPPTPLRGFGRVWCSFTEVRNGLGWATDAERGYRATVQDFDGGSVFSNDFGVTLVLYGDGAWEQK